jgi:SOUL heme-binding protein
MRVQRVLKGLSALVASSSLALAVADDGPRAARSKATEPPAAADSDAPLPEGWPAATKPEAIEVKVYPAYRCAVARDGEGSMKGQGKLFWPLFTHIQRKGIAMTSPVVMTFEPRVIERAGAKGDMSMEFLYRRPNQGEAGMDGRTVKVEDRPAGTFVCLGLQGSIDEGRMAGSIQRLRSWLADHKHEWVEAGPPRELGYHGPMTPARRRLWEVQIPVRPAANAQSPPVR